MSGTAALVACLAVGYACGCFLTADVVCRARLGRSAFDVGSHNPGMANVGSLLGVPSAAVVLAGDIGKTVVACALARFAVAPELGAAAVMWAGLGVTLGHDFPVWHRFKGGKGVTTTCASLTLAAPVVGVVSMAAGLATVAATRYLCFGAVLIPALWTAVEAAVGAPAGFIAFGLACTALALAKHGAPCWRALHGREPKTGKRR